MEFVGGESLSARLERLGKLPVGEVTRVMLHIGMALQAAHRGGVIHRDIKPANIIFDAASTPKLGDFGISQLAGEQDLTTTGTAMGTWVYASPEQLQDAKRVDLRSDLYSMGATMYEMLSGEMPRHIDESKIPEAIRPVLKKCLAKSPEERYQSAAEFVKGLTMAYNAFQRPRTATMTGMAETGAAPIPSVAPMPQGTQTPTQVVAQTAAPAPSTGGLDSRRRRRSTWRARGVAWSCPVRAAIGFSWLLFLLFSRPDVNGFMDDRLYELRRAVAPNAVGGLTNDPDEKVALHIINTLEKAPWFWGGLVAAAAVVVLPGLRRATTRYRLSATRLSVQQGILFKSEHDFPLIEIHDVHVSQGLLGMMLGYGEIDLRRGMDDAIVLQGIPHPSSVGKIITAACQHL